MTEPLDISDLIDMHPIGKLPSSGRIAQLERELAECKRQIESQHFAWCGCSQQLKDACADLDEVELQRDALAAKVVQMREALNAINEWAMIDYVEDIINDALALDTKPAEQILGEVWARALRKLADEQDEKGGVGLLPFELRRMADELDGRVD